MTFFRLQPLYRATLLVCAGLTSIAAVAAPPDFSTHPESNGVVSADGSTVVFQNWNDGNIMISRAGVLSPLGGLPGGPVGDPMQPSFVGALTPDGRIIVGSAVNAAGHDEAFRWEGGAMTGLGYLNGGGSAPSSLAQAVSHDGRVVAGMSSNAQGQLEPFRWENGTMQGLGFLGGGGTLHWASLAGISADGSVVAGTSSTAADGMGGFIWRGGVMQDIGALHTAGTRSAWTEARALSADGQVVVGRSSNALGRPEAFRWRGTMQGLGYLDGGGTNPWSSAELVNHDGSVVAGQSTNRLGQMEAFRWTAAQGMQGLGFLDPATTYPFAQSNPAAMTPDGSVIVGWNRSVATGSTEAFIWTDRANMRALKTVLGEAGVPLTGWQLTSATGISADGSVIIGEGQAPDGTQQMWIVRPPAPDAPQRPDSATGGVRPPAPPAGFITASELSASLAEMSRVAAQAQGVTASALSQQRYAAYQQCRPVAGERFCVAIAGEGRRWDGTGSASSAAGRGGNGGVTVAAYLPHGFAVGASVYAGHDSLALRRDGSSTTGSLGAGLYATYAPAPTGLRALVAVTANRLQLDTHRHTLNGSTAVVSSAGKRDGNGVGVLGNVGWGVALNDAVIVRPFAELQWSRARLDGYREQGGPFPVQWNSMSRGETVARLGTELQWQLRPDLDAYASAAWAQRIAESADAPTGTIAGLGDVTGSAGQPPRAAAEMALGLGWQVRPATRISASMGVRAGHSTLPQFSGVVGASFAF